LLSIARIVTSSWIDDNGVEFTSRVHELRDVTAASFANALDSGEPIIVTNGHHVMVLTAIDYVVGVSNETAVTDALVQDPWPPGYEGHPGGSRVMDRREVETLRTAWAVTTDP
jgi:hypothetical protein